MLRYLCFLLSAVNLPTCLGQHQEDWSYTENSFVASESSPCGSDTTEPCGPNNWGFKYPTCQAKEGLHQSPVSLATHNRYELKLQEVRYDINSCLSCTEATVRTAPHSWQLDMSTGNCQETFLLHRFSGAYYASMIDFHAPSEHTVDGKQFDMEVHIHHTPINPADGKLIVAVLIQALPDTPDHPFLAAIWEKGKELYTNNTMFNNHNNNNNNNNNNNETSHMATTFAPGVLNFVDRFLPSSGLNFDYFTYKGTETTPDCDGVQWVVFKYPAYTSTEQVEMFQNLTANRSAAIDETKTTNRPLQSVSDQNTVDVFRDGDCFARRCHNVFDLSLSLNVFYTGCWIMLLTTFTIAFEYTAGFIDSCLSRFRTANEMMARMYKELSILGLGSFCSFSFTASCSLIIEEEFRIAGERAHALMFALAVLFIIFSVIFLTITIQISKRWDRILSKSDLEALSFVGTTGGSLNPLPLRQMIDLGMCVLKHRFIERNSLDDDFDFQRYVKFFVSRNIVQLLDVSVRTWIFCLLVLALVYIVSVSVNETLVVTLFGVFLVFFTFLVILLCLQSFRNLLKNEGAKDLTSIVTFLQTRRRSGQSVGDTLEMAKIRREMRRSCDSSGHHLRPPNTAMSKYSLGPGPNQKKENNNKKPIQSHTASTRYMQRQKSLALMSKTTWVPFGSPLLIEMTLETSALINCFYIATYLFLYRELLEPWQHVVVVISALLSVGVLLPTLLIIKSVIQCFVNPDHEIIGEVLDNTRGEMEMRGVIVNNLVPSVANDPTQEIPLDQVLEIFADFDHDESFKIRPYDLVTGCQTMDLNISRHKTHRLVRFLDKRRNGYISGLELFDIVFEERISQVDKLIVKAFLAIKTVEEVRRNENASMKKRKESTGDASEMSFDPSLFSPRGIASQPTEMLWDHAVSQSFVVLRRHIKNVLVIVFSGRETGLPIDIENSANAAFEHMPLVSILDFRKWLIGQLVARRYTMEETSQRYQELLAKRRLVRSRNGAWLSISSVSLPSISMKKKGIKSWSVSNIPMTGKSGRNHSWAQWVDTPAKRSKPQANSPPPLEQRRRPERERDFDLDDEEKGYPLASCDFDPGRATPVQLDLSERNDEVKFGEVKFGEVKFGEVKFGEVFQGNSLFRPLESDSVHLPERRRGVCDSENGLRLSANSTIPERSSHSSTLYDPNSILAEETYRSGLSGISDAAASNDENNNAANNKDSSHLHRSPKPLSIQSPPPEPDDIVTGVHMFLTEPPPLVPHVSSSSSPVLNSPISEDAPATDIVLDVPDPADIVPDPAVTQRGEPQPVELVVPPQTDSEVDSVAMSDGDVVTGSHDEIGLVQSTQDAEVLSSDNCDHLKVVAPDRDGGLMLRNKPGSFRNVLGGSRKASSNNTSGSFVSVLQNDSQVGESCPSDDSAL